MAQGVFMSSHKHTNKAVFPDPGTAKMNEILLNANPFRFDAFDLMPGAIGGGMLNRGMVDYVGGKDAAAVLRGVQEAWDKIK